MGCGSHVVGTLLDLSSEKGLVGEWLVVSVSVKAGFGAKADWARSNSPRLSGNPQVCVVSQSQVS